MLSSLDTDTSASTLFIKTHIREVFPLSLSLAMTTRSAKALKVYQKRTISITAYLGEARICQVAANDCKWFVRALEFSSADCGIFLGLEDKLGQGGDAKTILSLLRDEPRSKLFALMDAKLLSAFGDKYQGVEWRFHVKPNQKALCQALLLFSTKEPDFIALLPMSYISKEDAAAIYCLPIRSGPYLASPSGIPSGAYAVLAADHALGESS